MSASDPSGGPAAQAVPAAPPVSLEERKAERAARRAAAAFLAMAAEKAGNAQGAPAAQPPAGLAPAAAAPPGPAPTAPAPAVPALAVPARAVPAPSVPAPSVAPAPAVVPPPAPPAVPPKGPRPAAPPAARRPVAAAPARARGRHWLVAASFALVVLLPTALAAWYLWDRAAPRYASTAGFSVRTEDAASAVDLLGGMAKLTGGSASSDSDILYQFIQSAEIVALVDARVDLRGLWSKPGGDWWSGDPLFAYAPGREGPNGELGTIEDLHAHWQRMVAVYNSPGTGLLNVEVQAFTPADAQAIAQALFEESQALVNRLSAIAQADATRYAEDELAANVERLKVARAALTRFRNETQIVDPASSLQSQLGILSSLESELATQLIDLDVLRQTAPEADPRIAQAEARIAVIEARIDAEREKVGLGDAAVATGAPMGAPAGGVAAGGVEGGAATDPAFADLVGQYESLYVDQEFAQQSYVAALAAYDSALADSQRKSRYLAAHVQPTLPQSATHPQRAMLLALTALFASLAWAIATLAAYAIRDRR